MVQRFFKPGQDRHAGEEPAFTKKRKQRREKVKAARAQRKKQR
jgi:hypothetical protein